MKFLNRKVLLITIVCNSKKVEIKGSLGWVTNGSISHYRFQQIRESQDYDIVAFVFFTPDEVMVRDVVKK